MLPFAAAPARRSSPGSGSSGDEPRTPMICRTNLCSSINLVEFCYCFNVAMTAACSSNGRNTHALDASCLESVRKLFREALAYQSKLEHARCCIDENVE